MARKRVGQQISVGGVAPHFAPAAIPIPAGNPQFVTWDRDDIVGQPGTVLVAVDPSVVLQNAVGAWETEPDPHYIAPSIYYQARGSQADRYIPLTGEPNPDPAPAENPSLASNATTQFVAKTRVGSTQYRQIGWPRVTMKWPWQK